MSKPLKTIPKFANETEESAFWEQHDSTDYLDWMKAQQTRVPSHAEEWLTHPSTRTGAIKSHSQLCQTLCF